MNLIQLFRLISVIILIIIWRNEALITRTLSCAKLSINNSIIRYAKRNSVSARVRCKSNYSLLGNNIIYCHNKQWVGDIPICVTKKPKCKIIESIPNGHIFMPSKYSNAVVSFSCHSGYKLVGADTIYCTSTKWNKILPQCIKTDDKNMETSCNFESSYLCGWSQDINHDFDWRRENNQNASGLFSYKPEYDHTYGKNRANISSGYYMYIETVDAQPGETARLFSPIYNIENFTCFEFYYNMYGSKDGTLQVYILLESQNVDEIKPIYIMNQKLHHVDEWHRANIELKNITESFQVIIEGIRGNSFESNIAIDDVKLLNNCNAEDIYGTTEQFETSTDIFDGLTCANRCNATEPEEEKCQCHPNCLDFNDCCPDYIHFCSHYVTSVDESTTEDNVDQTTSWIKESTTASTVITISSSQRPYTMTSAPTTMSTESQTTTKISKPSKTTSTFIPRRTLSIKPKTRTSPRNQQTTIRTTSTASTTTKTAQAINDMITIPQKRFDPEDEPKIDYESQAQEVTLEPQSSVHSYFIIFISVVSIASIIILSAVVVKYMRNLKAETNKNEKWNLATDVRYLTSDELLNFTLATPSKDSDLLLENS